MKIVAVIMAGGKGERFWPRSRRTMPKQFLSLTEDGKTMIQHTVERIKPLVNIEDVFVVTNKDYEELVKEQLTGLPEENILLEPAARNKSDGKDSIVIYLKCEKAIKRMTQNHTVLSDIETLDKLRKTFGKENRRILQKSIDKS